MVIKKKDMKNKVLVLGIGDIVLHDATTGLQTVRQMLSSVEWPGDVDVIQRLSDQCQLQQEWLSYEHLVIVVAVADGKSKPGSVHVSRARSADRVLSCGIVSPGLRRLVDTLVHAPQGPEVYLVVVSVKEPVFNDFHISRAVASLVPQVQMLLRGLVGMLTRQQECVYY